MTFVFNIRLTLLKSLRFVQISYKLITTSDLTAIALLLHTHTSNIKMSLPSLTHAHIHAHRTRTKRAEAVVHHYRHNCSASSVARTDGARRRRRRAFGHQWDSIIDMFAASGVRRRCWLDSGQCTSTMDMRRVGPRGTGGFRPQNGTPRVCGGGGSMPTPNQRVNYV